MYLTWGVFFMAGCANMARPTDTAEDAVLAKSARNNGATQETSDLLYLLLTAEIAGQRGQYDLALNNYLKAAKITKDAGVAERATQIALYTKKMDKAHEAVSLWIARDPKNVSARKIAALLFLKANQVDQAVEQLKILLTLNDAEIENTLIEVVKLLNVEAPKETAMQAMKQLVNQVPPRAEIHFAYALLAADKGEYQLALEEIKRALELQPDWNKARILQAQVMSQMGDSRAARDAIRTALQRDPGNARLRLIYSQFLVKAGDYQAAERELSRILLKEPDNQDARFGLAMAQMELNREEKAKRTLTKLLDVPKWQMQAFFYLGLIEAKKNNLSSALRWFDKVSTGPIVFDAQVNAITALINLGRLNEARDRLRKVRKNFPNEALRLYLLEVELLTKNKNYGEAFDLLNAALEEMPDQTELLYSRALVAEQLNKIDVMEADLSKILEKNPDDVNALNALGYTLADRNERLEDAERYLNRALALKPDDPAILDSYGWLQYRLGRYDRALEFLRRAYEAVNDPEIAAHLGEVLWKAQKHLEARKVWREALRKDPQSEDMQEVKIRFKEAFQ
jgi:tetratricopeptide (TPR) repeat protein